MQNYRSTLDEMKLKYGSLLNSYNCSDLDALRDALIRNKSLNEDIKRTKDVLNKKYKKGKGTLLKDIGELEGKIRNNWNIIPEESPYKLCKRSDKKSATNCSLPRSTIKKKKSLILKIKILNMITTLKISKKN